LADERQFDAPRSRTVGAASGEKVSRNMVGQMVTTGRPDHWSPKKMETFPNTTVPASLHDVDFRVKDSGRFADSGGWGWAAFKYAAASDTFTPFTQADQPPPGNDARCGLACTRSRRQGITCSKTRD
jgi:hypothetical protein